jgi:hypothetical protein
MRDQIDQRTNAMEEHNDQDPNELVIPFRRLVGYTVNKSPNPKCEGCQSESNEEEKEESKDFEHVPPSFGAPGPPDLAVF